MNIQSKKTHKEAFQVIGFSKVIRMENGYSECPKFWDEMYAGRYGRLFKTMVPENEEETAVLANQIGMFAVCRTLPGGKEFEYIICGIYQGGPVPVAFRLYDIPESDWVEFMTKGPLPKVFQKMNTYVYTDWMKAHADELQVNMGMSVEVYTAGNPMSPEYECGMWIPVKAK